MTTWRRHPNASWTSFTLILKKIIMGDYFDLKKNYHGRLGPMDVFVTLEKKTTTRQGVTSLTANLTFELNLRRY